MDREKCQEMTDNELILLYKEINSFVNDIDKEIEKVSDDNA